MNSETALSPHAACYSEPRQLSLFPLDPWGTEYAFEVVDHPVCGISRALIGPLQLGKNEKPSRIKCLAATEDGAFAAAICIDHPELEDPRIFWGKVEKELATARQRPIADDGLKWHLSSDDCLKPVFRWAIRLSRHSFCTVSAEIAPGDLVQPSIEPTFKVDGLLVDVSAYVSPRQGLVRQASWRFGCCQLGGAARSRQLGSLDPQETMPMKFEVTTVLS